MRSTLASLPLLAAVVLLSACAVNPVTGHREIALMSEAQELELGASSDEAIVAQYGLADDEALASYVREIGEAMVPVSHRPTLQFQFRLLDDPIVNAFALPGGYVYITRGILAYLNSEAALAGVMGHEIGHVTARHGVKRYTKQTLFGLGLGVGSILSEDFARFSGVASTAGQLLLLKYGRDDERQADQLGVEYATKIGYDTEDMAEFFRTLKRLTPQDGRLPSWMSTHPDPGERTETVHALTGQWQGRVTAPSGGFRHRHDRFLRHLDGLVFGHDPRQGFVREGIFHHPQLAFRFPVPAGWAVQNGRRQVLIVSADQDAAVFFQAESGVADARAAADRFVSNSKGTLLDRHEVLVAGQKGWRTLVRLRTEQGSNLVLSTFFPFASTNGGASLWSFHGLAVESAYADRENALRSPVDGFARETDPSILATQPVRVKIVEAAGADFEQLARRWPVPAEAELRPEGAAGLALLNGMQTTDRPEPDQLVKVLRVGN